jgi:hypothetical protein
MKDNPVQIADWLIEEHGLEEAKHVAVASIMQTQDVGDNYRLSVWREVRRTLEEKQDDAE